MKPSTRRGRKLLTATIGLATLVYTGCDGLGQSSGNLVAPDCSSYPDMPYCGGDGGGGSGGGGGQGGGAGQDGGGGDAGAGGTTGDAGAGGT